MIRSETGLVDDDISGEAIDSGLAMKLVTEIVVAYMNQRVLEPQELRDLVSDIRTALTGDAHGTLRLSVVPAPEVRAVMAPEASAADSDAPVPALPVDETVTDEFLYSLEDGRPYRTLRRHLMAKYGMTPEDYRRKWGLPADYPMVAPSYSASRSGIAKRIGLGTRSAKAAPRRKPRKR